MVSPFQKYFQKSEKRISFAGVTLPEEVVYLDYASSTPVDSRVLEAMMPWFQELCGNPAARLHPMGEMSEHGLAWARGVLASACNAKFDEVYFTSSATESNNLVIRGLLNSPKCKRHKIVVSAIEHSSILSTVKELENIKPNLEIAVLPVDSEGQINIESATQIIDEKTLCVCVIDVNNETGAKQNNLEKLVRHSHDVGALVHVDSSQGFVRSQEFSLQTLDYDTATLSSTKVYGPKGASALIVRKRSPKIRLEPEQTGGGHEFGMRSGTPNLPAIIGFAKAVELQNAERAERIKHYENLENKFLQCLKSKIDFKVYSNSQRVPGILTLSIQNVNAMKLIENAKTVCVSVGSACKTLQATSSHVLEAMGVPLDEALMAFRVSIGLPNSEQDVVKAAEILAEEAKRLLQESAILTN